MDSNDQRGEILLGNQTGNGILSREQLLILRQLCKDEERSYSDAFYRFTYIDKLLMENNIFQCDVADCDVNNLRAHVLENHADESYRKNAGASD